MSDFLANLTEIFISTDKADVLSKTFKSGLAKKAISRISKSPLSSVKAV